MSTSETTREQTQPSPKMTLQPPVITEEMASEIRCWICYVDYLESAHMTWTKPCKCRGTLGYAHELCLLKFIATKDTSRPACPQCQTPYRILSPSHRLFSMLQSIDQGIGTLIPYVLCMGIGISGIFVSSIYGVYALLSISGSDAETWLENPDWGWRVWLGLPLLPFVFIACRVEAFDHFLPLLPLWLLDIRSLHFAWPPSPTTSIIVLPWVRYVYNIAYKSLTEMTLLPLVLENNAAASTSSDPSAHPTSQDEILASRLQAVVDIQSTEKLDIPRHVVGALAIPAIASSVGWCLGWSPFVRKFLPSPFLRSVAGGCLFVAIKDMFYLYYRYQKLTMARRKQIVNYLG